MAFPTTGVLDDFNRADGPIGANWGYDPFNINSEIPEVRTNAFGSPVTRTVLGSEAWWAVTDFGPDSEAFFTIGVLPTDANFMYCWARGQQPSTSASTMDCYEVEWQYNAAGNATITIYRVIDTVSTSIAQLNSQPSANLAAGDKLGMEVLGTGATVTINVYKFQSAAWTNILTFGDTNAARITAAGNIGCGIYDGSGTAGRLDDFGGGTVGGGGGAITNAAEKLIVVRSPLRVG